jgi:hypothetical protein
MKNDDFIAFLVRVTERPYFTIPPYILCVPMAQRKDMYQMLIFYFKEHEWGSLIFYSQ